MPFGKYFPMRAQLAAGGGLRPADAEDARRSTRASATHHLQFAEDKDHTLYFSGDTNAIGWINTRSLGRDRRRREGAGLVPDRSSTRTATARSATTRSRTSRAIRHKDMRVAGFAYGIIVNPDGRIGLVGARRACRDASAGSSSGATRR